MPTRLDCDRNLKHPTTSVDIVGFQIPLWSAVEIGTPSALLRQRFFRYGQLAGIILSSDMPDFVRLMSDTNMQLRTVPLLNASCARKLPPSKELSQLGEDCIVLGQRRAAHNGHAAGDGIGARWSMGPDSPLWDRNMAWTWKPAVMESKAPGAICLVQAGGPVGGSLPTVPAAIRAGKRRTLGLRTGLRPNMRDAANGGHRYAALQSDALSTRIHARIRLAFHAVTCGSPRSR